jgi:hypothetical protein
MAVKEKQVQTMDISFSRNGLPNTITAEPVIRINKLIEMPVCHPLKEPPS